MLIKKKKKHLLCFLSICLSLTFVACATGTAATTSTNSLTSGDPGAVSASQPDWVRDPYTRYNRQTTVAARGSGNSREAAESSAFGNLVAFFGQSIEFNEMVAERYQEAVRNGLTANWSVNTEVDTMVARSAGLNTLIGAEIGDVWNDGISYFAVAVLNRARAIETYTNIVRANQGMIENLLNMSQAEKNTLDGYARYQFAATVADITTPYINLLSAIGSPVQGFRSGDDYRLEARNITRAIPISLRVQNDRSARVQGAFSKALSDLGFQSGGSNSRYALDVNVIISPVTITGSPYNWARMELSANLTDTGNNAVLFPYNFNLREGHSSQSEADNRVILLAERKIDEEYARLLGAYLSRDYLSRSLPGR